MPDFVKTRGGLNSSCQEVSSTHQSLHAERSDMCHLIAFAGAGGLTVTSRLPTGLELNTALAGLGF